MSVELHFNHHTIPAAPGKSLFECAMSLGIAVPTSCQRQGKCKECLVEVLEGSECLSPLQPAEKHLRGAFRLSCCCQIAAGSGTVRCQTIRRAAMRIDARGLALPGRSGLVLEPAVVRLGQKVLLDGMEIDQWRGGLYGLAMDLGTTTVVIRLIDLQTGEVIADASFENPQRFGGSDIMARIRYDTEDGSRMLQRTLAGYLAHTIKEFGVATDTIYELVVAGNSTMRDLFFGLDVSPIGQSPYQSVTEREMAEGRRGGTSVTETARRLRLPLNPQARVYGLPLISGHVGADAAACMLAVDLAREDRLVAVMDIGTNTELILGNRRRIMAASCPAGPAFEGGRISCGMPGLPGAIERVQVNHEGKFQVQVIDAAEPEGICGSGLVDLLATLVKNGRMNELGRYECGSDRLEIAQASDGPIALTEADINELAQAKGANGAGLQIIFDTYGADFDQVDVFYVAGGFGRYLDLDSARTIGLIPDLPDSKIRQVGNASIEGATIALLSMTRRRELEKLAGQVEHCRLEAHPAFFDFFVEACQFRHLRGSAKAGD